MVDHQLGGGASGEAREMFLAIAQTGRYADNVVIRLSRIISGRGGGQNRDTPIYELCHLMNIVNASGFGDAGSRMSFFMAQERVVPSIVGDLITHAVEDGGWRRDGFSSDSKGVAIEYADGSFKVRYGRMPLLMALYEFLCSIDDFAFFGELNNIFDEMLVSPVSIVSIKRATGLIASRFRKWRRANFDWAQYEEQFDRIFVFLKEHAEDELLNIDDTAILTFWLLHSSGKKFIGYKTVFEYFVKLLRLQRSADFRHAEATAKRLGSDFESGEREVGARDEAFENIDFRHAEATAKPLGSDFESGEREVGAWDDAFENIDGRAVGEFSTEGITDNFSEWVSPLHIFDAKGLSDINFFKEESERKPLENFLRYGPDAARLPQAFLRLESFVPVQAGITNDQQMKRGEASWKSRLSCVDAVSYSDIEKAFNKHLEHVKRMQLACLHVIKKEKTAKDLNIEAGDRQTKIIEDARKVFTGIKRKGFDESAFDENGKELFGRAAEGLVAISGQLENFLTRVRALNKKGDGLGQLFDEDREIFIRQFKTIYGEVA